MVSIQEDFGTFDEHGLENVFGFLTLDRHSIPHMYVVGAEGTAIDISDRSHSEYSGYETVENLVEDVEEKLIRVFEHHSDFSLKLYLE